MQLLVLYDADCGFCAWALALLLRLDRDRRVCPVAIQSEQGQRSLAGIPDELRLASWHALDAHDELRSGGVAITPRRKARARTLIARRRRACEARHAQGEMCKANFVSLPAEEYRRRERL
ncbi:MAG: DCC1-like thiol-disulfide oxidoreductase family protein [Solirubrobacteraceae bacterium]|jgi:predicted DCC family thiol-disulfide oxidoreductase YuxK